MILHVLRALFVLLMAAVGWATISAERPLGWLTLGIAVSVGVLLVCVDILSPRKKLAAFAGTFLGLLVGLLLAYGLSFVVQLSADLYLSDWNSADREDFVRFVNLCVGIVCCYFAISFILQTKDDFRFIIPYVEFSRQLRGSRPILIDTSVLIDGRILDIASTGLLDSRLIVPRFVLEELQVLADASDRLKRQRGRRGLDVLNKLQDHRRVEVSLYDWSSRGNAEAEGADQMLLELAKELGARLLTNDFNLSKVAQVRGVDAININDLAQALRPVVLPGERMQVKLLKAGEEPLQGVGYLDDGTMVVVEQGRGRLGEEVEFVVTNVLPTASGRIIFGRLGETPPRRRPNERSESDAEHPDVPAARPPKP